VQLRGDCPPPPRPLVVTPVMVVVPALSVSVMPFGGATALSIPAATENACGALIASGADTHVLHPSIGESTLTSTVALPGGDACTARGRGEP
jgi:hypothetical protein